MFRLIGRQLTGPRYISPMSRNLFTRVTPPLCTRVHIHVQCNGDGESVPIPCECVILRPLMSLWSQCNGLEGPIFSYAGVELWQLVYIFLGSCLPSLSDEITLLAESPMLLRSLLNLYIPTEYIQTVLKGNFRQLPIFCSRSVIAN